MTKYDKAFYANRQKERRRDFSTETAPPKTDFRTNASRAGHEPPVNTERQGLKMDTNESVTRLTDALRDAAPNSRVTVLSADLRALLERTIELEIAKRELKRMEEQIALAESPDFRSIDAWLK